MFTRLALVTFRSFARWPGGQGIIIKGSKTWRRGHRTSTADVVFGFLLHHCDDCISPPAELGDAERPREQARPKKPVSQEMSVSLDACRRACMYGFYRHQRKPDGSRVHYNLDLNILHVGIKYLSTGKKIHVYRYTCGGGGGVVPLSIA